MKRPTIPDLAAAAGVSVSTVNRVLNDPESVRKPTKDRVRHAAEEIGFYGLGTIESSVRKSRKTFNLGIILQQKSRTFYKNLGTALTQEAAKYADATIRLKIVHLEDLSPDSVANTLFDLANDCDSIGVVAAQHPLVAAAITSITHKGIPVTGLIAPLYASDNVSFVGLDNWKVGRVAAWAFDKMVCDPGKIGILVGNPRYHNQELNESGFRSYFREHNSKFTLLEPMPTYESSAVGRELVENLLQEHPDLCGIFVSGGGITGALAALRECPKRDDFVTVGYELFDTTRAGLLDGTLTMVIAHPLEELARQTIATLVQTISTSPKLGAHRVALDFQIYTAESL